VVRYRFVAVAIAVAGVCGALAAGAWAAPPTPPALTFELTGCEGPEGTPLVLTGVHVGPEGAALHLTNGGGNLIFMEAVDTTTGQTLFTTPGFGHNNLALVTCDFGPIVNSGLITPVR
jgi:hypothetical protein